jgi:hypothetical protein
VAGVSKYGVWNRLGRGIYDLIAISWYQKRRYRPVEVVALAAQPAGSPQRGGQPTVVV